MARQWALACVRAFLTRAHAAFLFAILDQTQVSVGFIFHESIPRWSCGLSDDIFPSSADVDIYGFALKFLNNY